MHLILIPPPASATHTLCCGIFSQSESITLSPVPSPAVFEFQIMQSCPAMLVQHTFRPRAIFDSLLAFVSEVYTCVPTAHVRRQGIERLERLSVLQKLELVYCSGLSDVFVATIGHMSSLTTLNLLKSDGVTQAGLAALTTLSKLKHLDLTGCNDVSDIVFFCLARLTRLESLILANCGTWSEEGIVSLTSLENLRLLDLGYLNTPLTDESLTGLTTGLSGLTSLDLSGAGNVTDAGFGSLVNCQHLQRLELEGCTSFGAFGISALSKLPHLTSLNLQECQRVEADALEMLTSLYGLRELNLLDCPGSSSPEVVDKLVACLPFLSTLTSD